MTIIEVDNLKKSYGNYEALRGISFSVNRGDIFGLLGPNGAGKTTTIYLILGLLQPDSGIIRLFEHEVNPNNKRVFKEVKQKIGVILESPGLYNNLSVYDYLQFYGEVYGLSIFEVKKRIQDVLAQVGLLERSKSYIGKLSKGMKQRVAIARALLHSPELLILDEPSISLDPEWQRTLREILLNLNKEGTTIFLCSHNLSEIERICNRVAIISNGEIKRKGNLAEILSICDVHIIVTLQNPSKIQEAQDVLVTEKGYKVIREGDNKLRVIGKRASLLDIVSSLHDKKIEIADIKEIGNTLENAYLEIVRK